MSIWFGGVIPPVKTATKDTLAEHLGIEYLEVGADFLRGRMPVDHRTRQPFGVLHGGASVALAETLMSYAANMAVDRTKQYCVGLEINANHVRSIKDGWATGTVRPVHLGGSTQVWSCEIRDDAGRIACISRMTAAVLTKPAPKAGEMPAG